MSSGVIMVLRMLCREEDCGVENASVCLARPLTYQAWTSTPVVIVREWPRGGRSFKAENSHHKDNISVVLLISSVSDV